MKRLIASTCAAAVLALSPAPGHAARDWVRIKELARVDGARENPLVGYGIVVGLAGTGDSARNRATIQSVANALSSFGVIVPAEQINSRNVAAVVVTAVLPPFANVGDRLDVQVGALGDARSLVGGSLVMTPLQGPDQVAYALAQGSVAVGGYQYDAFGNLVQKNHPNAGIVAQGGTVEKSLLNSLVTSGGAIHLLLHSPDFTTASRMADALADEFGRERLGSSITAEGPDRVVFRLTPDERRSFVDVLRRIEGTALEPDHVISVVVSERTGTVVAGGDVRVDQITVTHGDLNVRIDTEFVASQPVLVSRTGSGVRTVVVPNTNIAVKEPPAPSVSLPKGTTVADLIVALNKIKATPRDIVTILQAIRRAGALHADLIVQ
jgi:flagellar P-ring protein precursor FlgI